MASAITQVNTCRSYARTGYCPHIETCFYAHPPLPNQTQTGFVPYGVAPQPHGKPTYPPQQLPLPSQNLPSSSPLINQFPNEYIPPQPYDFPVSPISGFPFPVPSTISPPPYQGRSSPIRYQQPSVLVEPVSPTPERTESNGTEPHVDNGLAQEVASLSISGTTTPPPTMNGHTNGVEATNGHSNDAQNGTDSAEAHSRRRGDGKYRRKKTAKPVEQVVDTRDEAEKERERKEQEEAKKRREAEIDAKIALIQQKNALIEERQQEVQKDKELAQEEAEKEQKRLQQVANQRKINEQYRARKKMESDIQSGNYHGSGEGSPRGRGGYGKQYHNNHNTNDNNTRGRGRRNYNNHNGYNNSSNQVYAVKKQTDTKKDSTAPTITTSPQKKLFDWKNDR